MKRRIRINLQNLVPAGLWKAIRSRYIREKKFTTKEKIQTFHLWSLNHHGLCY